ncbi:MAG: HAMP domain-containing sensor histidine kinase [Eubacteriales bacterium]|nr:HAMP domain-containing sensor histidine kinase [Eubacteriales bacterium]
MKLFKRIFLQVFAGCILLTMIPLLYFLYESEQQSLKSVYLYETNNLRQNSRQFQEKLWSACMPGEAQAIWDLTAVQEFRTLIGTNGALYRGAQQLYNASPYEFDAEGIRKTTEGNMAKWSIDNKEQLSRRNLQEANERKLMIFGEEWAGVNGPSYYIIYYKDVTDVCRQTEGMFYKGLCFAAVLLALIGTVLYYGIYRSIRPLLELRRTAAAIAEGSYESRASVHGRDEIGELAVSFNQMACKVEAHVEELSHVNQMQRQLIGSLAHELKTPMTAILGYADTLLTVGLSEKRRIQALNYIGSESRRLSRLSAKMMELTGLYDGMVSISVKEIKAEPFLKRLKDLTAYRLKEKNIQLTISCSQKDLTFQIDEDLMMSLLMNLIDNACKASVENSVITVAANLYRISVTDTGKGIPTEELERVTEAFYMVDKSRAKSAGSVGLGLTLCKQIADLHGAELILESREGKGTRVSVVWEQEAVTKQLQLERDLVQKGML